MVHSIEQAIDEIFSLYERYGDADHIGEPVSLIRHMSQAAQLAIRDGWNDEVILAAFFHDIGHFCVMDRLENDALLDGCGIRYEQIGADYLREKGFPEKIASLVENHAQAKRYLTSKYPQYYLTLSDTGRKPLESQEEHMNEAEAFLFENNPLFEISIAMRQWDELAKEANIPPMDLSIPKRIAEEVLHETFTSSMRPVSIRNFQAHDHQPLFVAWDRRWR